MRVNAFEGNDAPSVLRAHLDKQVTEIRNLNNDYIMCASPTELESKYLEEAIVKPLILHVADAHIEERKSVQVDVRYDRDRFVRDMGRPVHLPGTEVRLAVPYEGDKELWKVRPSSWSLSGYPEIEVRSDSILLCFRFADDSPNKERFRQDMDEKLRRLASAVQTIFVDVQRHNAEVPEAIRSALATKREQALKAADTVSALGFPMKRRDEPATYVAPVQRRKLPIAKPKPMTGPYIPEPVLEAAEYEHILKVIRSLSLVVERNPSSFATMDEESIRDHILLQLNGHYEGAATGETFNSSGKTDILVRVNERNIFIAECKFWHGPKKFADTIDQLFDRYLTWRDCKCAIIVFNRQRNSSLVAEKMHETMQAHKNFRKLLSHASTGDSRYVFVKASDPGRDIVVTTQLFDIPSGDEP